MFASACSASVLHGLLDRFARPSVFGLNSWFSSECEIALARRFGVRGMRLAGLLCLGHGLFLRAWRRRRIWAAGATPGPCSSAGSLQHLGDQLLGAALAVHVGQQVGQLGARLEQLAQRLDLARDRGRARNRPCFRR